MLYSSLLLGSLLVLSKGQDCMYSADLADDNLYSDNAFENSLDDYDTYGDTQYVIFDFNFDATSVKGAYFLPFTFTNSTGDSACHSSAFSTSAWMDFSCSTGYEDGSQEDTRVTMTLYSTLDGCVPSEAAFTYWWDEGYSAYYDPDTLIPILGHVCTTSTECEDMNFTRSAVTQGSGSRYDFSCEGDAEYVKATLCADSACGSTVCSTVSAAIGAGCLASPNSTYGNLMVSCDKKNAYLTTFVDVDQFVATGAGAADMWNDYTVDRVCSNSPQYTSDALSGGGYICNQFDIPKDTCTESFEALGFTIYGYMHECSDPFGSAANSLSFSFIAISFSVIIAIFKL